MSVREITEYTCDLCGTTTQRVYEDDDHPTPSGWVQMRPPFQPQSGVLVVHVCVQCKQEIASNLEKSDGTQAR